MSAQPRPLSWSSEAHAACARGELWAWQQLLDYVSALCRREADLSAFDRDRVRARVTDLLWKEGMRRILERPSPVAVSEYIRVIVRNEAGRLRRGGPGRAQGPRDRLGGPRASGVSTETTSSGQAQRASGHLSLDRPQLLLYCGSRLTHHQMEVVRRRLEGESSAAIGKAIGRTEDAVKKVWRGALRRLGRLADLEKANSSPPPPS